MEESQNKGVSGRCKGKIYWANQHTKFKEVRRKILVYTRKKFKSKSEVVGVKQTI